MKPTRNPFLCASIAITAFSAASTQAQQTWIGGGNASLSDANNYSPNTALSGSSNLSYNTAGATAHLVTGLMDVGKMTFQQNATFYGRQADRLLDMFAIGGVGIQVNSGVTTTFNQQTYGFGIRLNLINSTQWNVDSGGLLQFTAPDTGARLTGVGETLTIQGSGNTTFSGGGNIDGTGNLAKDGTGTLTLSGTNTYIGTTTITNGTLAVTGSGDINSTTGVNIGSSGTFRYNSSVAYSGGAITNNGGTITGTGDIGVAVTLDSLADKLAPGNSPGIQEYTVAQTWNSFTYQWETNNFAGTAAGTDFDQIQVAGTLNLTGAAANSYALDVLSLTGSNATGLVPNFSETNRQWTILTASGGVSNFNAAYWNILTSGFTSDPSWTGTFSLTSDANNIYLNYNVVPEPRAALLGGLGMLSLLRRRRA